MMRGRVAVAVTAVLLGACAHPAGSFRLVRTPANMVVVPPGVKDASVERNSIRIAAGHACAQSESGLRVSGKALIVSRAWLTGATADDLDRWAACLGDPDIRDALINSVPLEVSKRRVLWNTAELNGFSSLRVVSPVVRAGADSGTRIFTGEPTKVTGTDASITVEMKANPDVTGYEIAWYDVQPRSDGSGLRIVPRGAEVHVGGEVEKKAAPEVNRFDFSSDARWFRYFVMTRVTSDRNDHNIVLLGAPTERELEQRSEAFRKDATSFLQSAAPKSFAALSGAFGVNPYIRIRVNGVSRDVSPGSTVGQVIEPSALPQLRISRPYRGRMAPVVWDRGGQEILNLPLEGGEELSW